MIASIKKEKKTKDRRRAFDREDLIEGLLYHSHLLIPLSSLSLLLKPERERESEREREEGRDRGREGGRERGRPYS